MKNNKILLTLSIACLLSIVGCNNTSTSSAGSTSSAPSTSSSSVDPSVVQENFTKYCDDVLIEYLGGDQLAINLFFNDASSFGFEHGNADWYTYERSEEGDIDEVIAENERLLGLLHEFDYEVLTDLQKVTYRQIEDMFKQNIEFYSIENVEFMNLYYIDQFGGYVANFSSYMETYKLRNEQDVKDIITCIQSTEDAFKSYLLFAEDKVTKGYPYSDFTLNSMKDFLTDLEEQNEEYYLYDFLDTKIEGCEFLDEAKIAEYKAQAKEALTNDFFVGVAALNDGLDQFLGKCSADKAGYWSSYGEVGKQLFVMELKDVLGMPNLDMDEYIATLDAEIEKTSEAYMSAFTTLQTKHGITSDAALNNYLKYYPICGGSLDDKMSYLKTFAKTIVPDLKSEPEITIKEMDLASAAVSNAVAYYTKSAVDEFDHEYITLNPLKLDSDNDVLGTLSHEGYPGHLYEYVFAKELNLHPFSQISGNLAHGEGWATYVEYALYNYAEQRVTGSSPMAKLKAKDMIKYLRANHEMGYLLECRIDVGIHYQGWNVDQVAGYLGSLGYNSAAAQEIHDLVIEMPATYAAYGYGKYFFIQLHKDAKEKLGAAYNEVEYNGALLSKGWVGLDMLKEVHDEYIASKTQG